MDTRVAGSTATIEEELSSHLHRHAAQPGVVDLARPVLHQAIDEVGDGVVLISLDWRDQNGRLIARRLDERGSGELPGQPVGPGVARAHELTTNWSPERPVFSVDLAVARLPERDMDLEPADIESVDLSQQGSVTGLLARELAAGRPLSEAAAVLGATLASANSHRLSTDATAAEVAAAVAAVKSSMGGRAEVVRGADDRSATIRVRRCPFGGANPREMCRYTSSLTGGLAARAAAEAHVSVAETLAMGDHQCEIHVELQPKEARPTWHRYRWPREEPTEPVEAAKHGQDQERSRGFSVTLSLQLPRDRVSVPITRHLIRAAMDEVGVPESDADAVELAVTEACANVIDHSGPGDAYDVAVTIGPDACHIRVIDIGRGFDQSSVTTAMASSDAEHGRGMALMHALVDHVRLESEPERGTVVHLVKRLDYPENARARELLRGGGTPKPDPG